MKGDACHGSVKACLERHPLNSNISKESLQRYNKWNTNWGHYWQNKTL